MKRSPLTPYVLIAPILFCAISGVLCYAIACLLNQTNASSTVYIIIDLPLFIALGALGALSSWRAARAAVHADAPDQRTRMHGAFWRQRDPRDRALFFLSALPTFVAVGGAGPDVQFWMNNIPLNEATIPLELLETATMLIGAYTFMLYGRWRYKNLSASAA